MFGLGIDQGRQIQLVPETRLELGPGRVVFVTGPSGGGKSTVLRLVGHELQKRNDVRLLRFDDLPGIDDQPLVDCFPNRSLSDVLRLLSLAGLNDAFVMLRTPSQLSDGQRYRLRLAQAMAMFESKVFSGRLNVLVADEFGATLDRTTAQGIARNVRRWVSANKVCFIAATTHDDLLEYFSPDTLIEKQLGETIHVLHRSNT